MVDDDKKNQLISDFYDSCQHNQVKIPREDLWRYCAPLVWECSDYAFTICLRRPQLLYDLVVSGDLFRAFTKQDFVYRFRRQLQSVNDEKSLQRVIRGFRDAMMLRMIWRDVAQWCPLQETLEECSWCAEIVIDQCNKLLFKWQRLYLEEPPRVHGRPAHLLVVAVGKLGGMELNYSSDVDLIFFSHQPGLDGSALDKVNEFYVKQAQALLRVLHQTSEASPVFRVDLRLRPYGQSGPLVFSSDAAKIYYENHAREWERYALLKARIISGDPRSTVCLQKIIDRFVYRPHLDYAIIETLRKMHAMWVVEAARYSRHQHIKMGRGGIREIEFIVQYMQLTRGGQEPRLRQVSFMSALSALQEEGLLPYHVADELESSYAFLRVLENRLQAYQDSQTHVLPVGAHQRSVLARGMAFESWSDFLTHVDHVRSTVRHYFATLIFQTDTYRHLCAANEPHHVILSLWHNDNVREGVENEFKRCFPSASAEACSFVHEMMREEKMRHCDQALEIQLAKLICVMLVRSSDLGVDHDSFTRSVLVLLSALPQRSYLILLLEHRQAIDHLLVLSGASLWAVERLCRYPFLLGELIDEQSTHQHLTLADLKRRLLTWLRPLSSADEGEIMRVVAHFKMVHVFRIVLLDVLGMVTTAQASNFLTFTAEAIVQHVLRYAWRSLRSDGLTAMRAQREPQFLIVAYGKMGGLELGYGSDLDLVFLIDGDVADTICQSAYTKLAQKFLSLMAHQTISGPLYTVDTRLRAMGRSGLIVQSMGSFLEYLCHQARNWEHQALVRARAVYGPKPLREKFYQIRQRVLQMHRCPVALWQTVSSMRQKIMHSMAPLGVGMFDLKRSRGGINDIEFIVQYLVLNHAQEHASLSKYTDNIRLLEVLGRLHLLLPVHAKLLYDAFLAYRTAQHRLDLQREGVSCLRDTKFRGFRSAVERIWGELEQQGTENDNSANSDTHHQCE